MIPLTRSDYELHFFGKYYSAYFFEYGKARDNFGDIEYSKLIEGKTAYAIYPLREGNYSSYIVLDVDGPNDGGKTALPVVKNLKKFLESKELKPTIFFSGSKGFHTYLFFDSEEKASDLIYYGKILLKEFNNQIDGVKIELFPKQEKINPKDKNFGNHLKAPLSIHPKTGEQSKQLTDYVLNRFPEIKKPDNLDNKLFDLVDVEILSNTVAPYFTDGNRHKIALGLSGYFCFNHVDKNKVLAIFVRILEIAGGDTNDILRVVHDTYSSGRTPADLSFAGLPRDVEEIIFLYISGLDPERIKGTINNIRSTKSQPHVKVDNAAKKIIEFLKARYRLYRDDNFIYLIYGDRIFSNFDPSFESLLLYFGINTEESFAKQVRKVILDFLYNNAEYNPPINFCEFKQEKILLYTKDSIIETSKIGINTSNEFLPVTNRKQFKYIPNNERKITVDAYLENFKLGMYEKDLIVGWLVSQFFNEGVNTKPILLIQGQPGSGKSTLAKFLIRLIENRDTEISAYTGKDDALIASLQKHKVLVLDNLEYINSKTMDLINAVVTGATIELRALYTTNQVALIKPKSSLVITSAHGTFDNDGAFQSRLVKVRLSDRLLFSIESIFWEEFDRNYNDLVSDLLDLCTKVLKHRINKIERDYKVRMTDFIDICWSLKEEKEIFTDIEKMILIDQERDKYNIPFLKIFLKIRFREEIYNPFTIDEIYGRFRAVANSYGLDKITAINLGGKLLKTGIFTLTSSGYYKLLKPLYYQIESVLDELGK